MTYAFATRLCLAPALLLLALHADAALVLDDFGSFLGDRTAPTPQAQFNIDIAAGNDRGLLFGVEYTTGNSNNQTASVTAVDFGGDTPQLVGQISNGGISAVDVFWLASPDVGTSQLTVDLAASDNLRQLAVSWLSLQGVKQDLPAFVANATSSGANNGVNPELLLQMNSTSDDALFASFFSLRFGGGDTAVQSTIDGSPLPFTFITEEQVNIRTALAGYSLLDEAGIVAHNYAVTSTNARNLAGIGVIVEAAPSPPGNPTPAVPEPATLGLALLAGAGLLARRR